MTPTATQTATPGPTATPTATARVEVALDPAYKAVEEWEIFTLDIVLRASVQAVDGAEVYLDFDPDLLQVVDEAGNPVSQIIPAPALDTELVNQVDNAAGQINYAAARIVGPYPTGTFVLATVRFRAKAETAGTWVLFHRGGDRDTRVAYAGQLVHGPITDGLVVITEVPGIPAIYLPLLLSAPE